MLSQMQGRNGPTCMTDHVTVKQFIRLKPRFVALLQFTPAHSTVKQSIRLKPRFVALSQFTPQPMRLYLNDPSAGSPTDTVLRLDQTLDDRVYKTSQVEIVANSDSIRIIHRIIQSIDATGGVYKGQGRNQHKLMTYAY